MSATKPEFGNSATQRRVLNGSKLVSYDHDDSGLNYRDFFSKKIKKNTCVKIPAIVQNLANISMRRGVKTYDEKKRKRSLFVTRKHLFTALVDTITCA